MCFFEVCNKKIFVADSAQLVLVFKRDSTAPPALCRPTQFFCDVSEHKHNTIHNKQKHLISVGVIRLEWHHNERDGVSNHRRIESFIHAQIKENIKLRVTGLCEENSPGTGVSPQKGPVTRKIFPYDDTTMVFIAEILVSCHFSHRTAQKTLFTMAVLPILTLHQVRRVGVTKQMSPAH